MYLDFKMESGSKVTQAIPKGWTAFIYILAGTAKFGKISVFLIDLFVLVG